MSTAEIVTAFKLQSEWCHKLGSPLYGELLEHASSDLAAGGPIARVISGWSGNPIPDALALRLMGAVHALVLAGGAPDLARFYPSAGGAPRWPDAWETFIDTVDRNVDSLRAALARGVQTNEVNRCAALLGGFLHVADRTGLPLRVLEVGASAGLNLNWDRYRYEYQRMSADPLSTDEAATDFSWGDATSGVMIRATWEGSSPLLNAPLRVASRAGCDIAPIDVRDPIQVQRIESFVWPDQLPRLQQLRAAIHLATGFAPVGAEKADVVDWLNQQLTTTADGVATIVYHSIFWWYLSEEQRQAMTDLIREAGTRAREQAPLAWLQFEMRGAKGADVDLTLWPSGEKVLLGRADPHGRTIRWFNDSTAPRPSTPVPHP
jgi:hypothetical protein